MNNTNISTEHNRGSISANTTDEEIILEATLKKKAAIPYFSKKKI
jgi:hypothetical protein